MKNNYADIPIEHLSEDGSGSMNNDKIFLQQGALDVILTAVREIPTDIGPKSPGRQHKLLTNSGREQNVVFNDRAFLLKVSEFFIKLPDTKPFCCRSP